MDAPALEDPTCGRTGGLLMESQAVKVSQIAVLLGATLKHERMGGREISCVGGVPGAGSGVVVFASDEHTLSAALASGAGLILAPEGKSDDERVLEVRDPRSALARVYREWFDERGGGGVHPSAVVEEGVICGAGCEIGSGAYLGRGVRLGKDCVIGPRVVVYPGTRLGDRVRVQAGAVLGSDGFGYVREKGGYFGFPQVGTLWIGDDVEIGANTTIDRGALGETRIGGGTKIDNLVHIAHNCVVGEHVIIAAQVGMAGSCVIEDGAMLGGQVGLGERVVIGKGVILGGQGGVLPGKRIDGEGTVFWGTPAQPVKQYLRDLARLRRR